MGSTAMPRKRRNIWASGIAAGLVSIVAISSSPGMLHGFDAGKAPPPGKLVVHEWGTFTSFSGTDGVNLECRPLVTNDLPRFIMTPFNQPGSLGRALLKTQFFARQRMETPVTYFYTDAPRTVNVRVDFPQGALTEWYPVVKNFQSGKADGSYDIIGRAYLDWGAVHLTPSKQFATIRVQGPKKQAVPASL